MFAHLFTGNEVNTEIKEFPSEPFELLAHLQSKAVRSVGQHEDN